MLSSILIWLIAGASIAGVLFRPKNWPEAIWACLGALALVVCGLLPWSQAGAAVAKGSDVYLFLTGMMLLSELARSAGVFDWLASVAAVAAKGSRARLFTLVYLVGTAVTIFLSNDATAVVLTPAVYAAVQKARVTAFPYLLICAFIANAASFVLPISNPANLVVYGKSLPPLLAWLQTFFLPSVCSVVATYAILRWTQRGELSGTAEAAGEPVVLSHQGRFAAGGIIGTGLVLMCASAFGLDLGLPAALAAAAAILITTRADGRATRDIAKAVSWTVLPLVAGLFVLVEGLNRAGASHQVGRALQGCARLPKIAGGLAAAFGVAGLSNLMNNLPSGLLAAGGLQVVHVPSYVRDSVLIGIDLGPNLSVAGSLATVLWLIALRREGERISAWKFLKTGALVMPPALLLATLAVCLW